MAFTIEYPEEIQENKEVQAEVMGIGPKIPPTAYSQLPIENREGGEGEASYPALQGEAFVEDPRQKLLVIGKDVMPGIPDDEILNRMALIEGRFVYLDPKDDKLRVANPDTFKGFLKESAASLVSMAPSASTSLIGEKVGTLIGIPGGPPGMIAGGIIGTGAGYLMGRLGERKIAEEAYGEDVDYGAEVPQIATETALVTALYGAGRAFGGAINAKRGIQRNFDSYIKELQKPDVLARLEEARASGITLTPGEITGSPYMITLEKELRQGGGEASTIMDQFFKEVRPPQVERIKGEILNAITPENASAGELSKKASTAAAERLKSLDTARHDATTEFYTRAWASGGKADKNSVSDIVSSLDRDIAVADSKQRKVLQALKSDLLEETGSLDAASGERIAAINKEISELSDTRSNVFVSDAAGGDIYGDSFAKIRALKAEKAEILSKAKQPVTDNLEKLHNIRMGIDASLMNPNDATSLDKSLARKVMGYRKRISEVLTKASPDVAEGDALYAELSRPLDELGGTDFMRIARLEGDNQYKAARRIFDGGTPESIAKARAEISAVSPDAWDGLVKAHIMERFDQAAKDGGITTGRFFNVLNTERDRKLLQAALTPEQYKIYEGYIDLFRKAARSIGQGSDTQPKTVVRQVMEGQAGWTTRSKILKPLEWKDYFAERWNSKRFDDFRAGYARAILSDNPLGELAELRKIQKLTPGTLDFWARAGSFLAQGRAEYQREKKTPDYRDTGAQPMPKRTISDTIPPNWRRAPDNL